MDGAMLQNTVVRTGWVNGNKYQFANETFGTIWLLPMLFKPLGMFEFSEEYACKQKIQHKYVAEHQGTLVAVLSIGQLHGYDIPILIPTPTICGYAHFQVGNGTGTVTARVTGMGTYGYGYGSRL
ncbi:hypothetical protein BU15DRAFT_67554 [Melanogaster broomeanus]|nr:hypothetical protein BU15DRAFT_67554 [Melanogaster broomeanus]